MKLTPDSVVVVSKDQMASDIAGETVILGLSAGRYYGLDAVGARIWQLIQTPKAVADVRQTIVQEYEVDPGRCEADLLQLLEKMLAAGLVEIRRDAEARSDAAP
jgi:Coenzyme PQQ synthesis protein D (PqqD)